MSVRRAQPVFRNSSWPDSLFHCFHLSMARFARSWSMAESPYALRMTLWLSDGSVLA